eukprot:8463188-Pyramimonas_sp.AAC.2
MSEKACFHHGHPAFENNYSVDSSKFQRDPVTLDSLVALLRLQVRRRNALTTGQLYAGSAGMFSRRANCTQEVR